MAERLIEVVIRAKDEFSGPLSAAQEKAGAAVDRVRESLEKLNSGADGISTGAARRYMTGLDKAFTELRNGLKNASDEAFTSGQDGADRAQAASLERMKGYHRVYLEEKTRLFMAERSMDEARRNETDALEQISWANRIRYAETATGMMANTMQNLFIATGSKNKAMFEAMKAFAIAETVIQTFRAAQGAYAALAPIPIVGPALGAAAAAAAIAAGLARVEQIKNTKPGDATSSISAVGRANPQYSGGSPDAYPVPTRLEDGRPAQYITVQIYNPLSEQNWQKIVDDNIIPALKDAGDRNITLSVRNMGGA